MRNGNELSAILSEAEQTEVQQKLMELLKLQIRRYTGGESSSVPAELAQELFTSICFSLRISAEQPDERWRKLLGKDMDKLLKQGQLRIQMNVIQGEKLWQNICLHLPQVENTAMVDTLQSIGSFWKHYDWRYFAHVVLCDIDYQLAVPISEQYMGVDYVNRYLERLTIENTFLQQFAPEKLDVLLNRYCPDYHDLILNLFEPVFVNALGLTILGESAENLLFSPQLVQNMTILLCNLDRQRLSACFVSAAQDMTKQLVMQSHMEQAYILQNAQLFAERVLAVRDIGGLTGIFL